MKGFESVVRQRIKSPNSHLFLTPLPYFLRQTRKGIDNDGNQAGVVQLLEDLEDVVRQRANSQNTKFSLPFSHSFTLEEGQKEITKNR